MKVPGQYPQCLPRQKYAPGRNCNPLPKMETVGKVSPCHRAWPNLLHYSHLNYLKIRSNHICILEDLQ